MPDRKSSRFVRVVGRHPRWAMAVRAALAAILAWYAAHLLPAPASDYPYYAPMGAVVATSTTLAGSFREAMQSVASIALGGLIAAGVHLAGRPENPVVMAVAIAVGVLAAGWPVLGAMGSWVPISALFTLIIGGGGLSYVGVYAGLVLLGAAIGVAVLALTPPLQLTPAEEAVGRVRDLLRSRLEDFADVLDGPRPPQDRDAWDRHRKDLEPDLIRMRTAVGQAQLSARGNTRARLHADALDALRHQAQELDHVATLLHQVGKLLQERENRSVDVPALGPQLRPVAADALRRLAEALHTVTGPAADPTAVARARRAVADLAEHTERSWRPDLPIGGIVAASTVIMAVRQCLDAIDPDVPPA